MHSEVVERRRQHETIVEAVAAAVESGKRINVKRLRTQAPNQSRSALYSQVARIKKRLLHSRGLQKNRDLSVDGSTGSAAERPHQDQQSLVTSQANAASSSETICVPRWPDVPHSDARSPDEGSAPPSHCIASGDWSESQAERQMLALQIRNGELLVEREPSDPGRDEFQELQMRIRALESIIARDAQRLQVELEASNTLINQVQDRLADATAILEEVRTLATRVGDARADLSANNTNGS